MSKDEIGFEHKGIGAIISQNRFSVPLNQREYSWEEEHVQELFSDFANAILKHKATYFLGTIVLTRGEGDVPEVSDGQQRLATTTIYLAAIRDYFFRKGDKARAQAIETEYLMSTDLETTDTVPKLRLNVDDNEFFRKHVIASPDSQDRKTTPSKDSHRRIETAARVAARHLKEILAPYKEDAHKDRLLEWVKFIRNGALVILLRVPDHLNAFVMFETLNDRGLKASQADLLKNYLLSFADDRLTEAQQKWAQMLGTLESLGRGDITVTYLHHFLILKHGPTREREVFDKVKETIDSRRASMEFLEELSDSANDYAALFNSDHKKWNDRDYGTNTRKSITTINRDLRIEQIRPLMFAVSKYFSAKEAQKAYRAIVRWSVRLLIVGGRGGLLDRNYAVAAQEIGKSSIKTADQLIQSLKDVIPTDALFQASFAEARVSKGFLARYYLRALEMKRKGDAEPEFIPSDDEHVINLEHILPENPDETNWPNLDAETAAALYNRLGNMAIMQAKSNSVIGNSSFGVKKAVFQKSGFLLTSEIANEATWSAKEIAQRQEELAKLAVVTWPIS